jgi:hypothetical protein
MSEAKENTGLVVSGGCDQPRGERVLRACFPPAASFSRAY